MALCTVFCTSSAFAPGPTSPRLTRQVSISLVFAVLIYLTYSNLINLSQAWVRSGSLPFGLAWWPFHLLAFLGAVMLFRYRQRYSLGGWRAVFGLRRRTPQGDLA